MLEDFAVGRRHLRDPSRRRVDRGQLEAVEDRGRWEKRLRRALGDDYELLALLGSGGFGRVYRVRDLHLEREVALKVLHPALTQDPEVVERFRREAQLAARLSHPNIVNIYDIAGRFGLIWYTMELIDGPEPGAAGRAGGAAAARPQVLRLLREALSALAHAHGSGLVHRDIKPENMLIDPTGSLQITDFGLALALRGQVRRGHQPERHAPVRESRAAAGRAGGSALRPLQPGRRGVLRPAGHAAVPGRDDRAGAGAADHQPASRPPRALREDVSEALERVLDRALSADVESRYPSAAEFLQALNRAAEARAPGSRWRTGPGRRHGGSAARLLTKCSRATDLSPRLALAAGAPPYELRPWRHCCRGLISFKNQQSRAGGRSG